MHLQPTFPFRSSTTGTGNSEATARNETDLS